MPILESNKARAERLWKENKSLRYNSYAVVKTFSELDKQLKDECFNYHRKWSNQEIEILRNRFDNVWSKLRVVELAAQTGRTPLALVNSFLYTMWADVKSGDLKLFERTSAQMPQDIRQSYN